jgi:hypothetical protein
MEEELQHGALMPTIERAESLRLVVCGDKKLLVRPVVQGILPLNLLQGTSCDTERSARRATARSAGTDPDRLAARLLGRKRILG